MTILSKNAKYLETKVEFLLSYYDDGGGDDNVDGGDFQYDQNHLDNIEVESYYGTEYHVDRVSESLLSQWQVRTKSSSISPTKTQDPPLTTCPQNCGTLPDLSLPPANPLISSLPPLVHQEGAK